MQDTDKEKIQKFSANTEVDTEDCRKQLERGDIIAVAISGFFVFVLPITLIMLLAGLVTYFFFAR